MSSLPLSWQKILHDAIHTPGTIHTAYTRFHSYSLGNQLLALFQCTARNIQPGPIGTFPHWKDNGRHVRKGEKAITLCMPITCKAKRPATADDGTESEQESCYTRFIYKNQWFVLSQTDGAEYQPEPVPDWDESTALAALGIERIQFDGMDGNCQGYAMRGRKVSVSPLAAPPHKTLFHECGHVLLGHCEEGNQTDSEHTPRSLREIEAEATALLCIEALDLPGAEFSRGYIQAWGSEIPERSAQKVFHSADLILKAGRKAEVEG